jgi:hypothetical protein
MSRSVETLGNQDSQSPGVFRATIIPVDALLVIAALVYGFSCHQFVL